MRIGKLLLVNILAVVSVQALFLCIQRIKPAADISLISLLTILLTPIVLIVFNYKIESRRDKSYYLLNAILILIGCGLGLTVYLFSSGFTLENWRLHHRDYETFAIGMLLVKISAYQWILGSILCMVLLRITNTRAIRANR
ncbi:hypothetical protein V1498_12675 [Peribacillus sp. SCS-26]|uniref:hypothetical protein n=1 Tax=Paraperibacillus marinus TaxID=3115295 RepID=UPI003905C762